MFPSTVTNLPSHSSGAEVIATTRDSETGLVETVLTEDTGRASGFLAGEAGAGHGERVKPCLSAASRSVKVTQSLGATESYPGHVLG
jgi:hypothetical protein